MHKKSLNKIDILHTKISTIKKAITKFKLSKEKLNLTQIKKVLTYYFKKKIFYNYFGIYRN
jgi:hypothetical protein